MKTAKELAFKAFFHGIEIVKTKEMHERFESWWSDNYIDVNFHPEHNVYVDGKRYIQGE